MNAQKNDISETLCFMALMTAVGGYVNAYSFITRDALTSMMTGNMARIGIALAQMDKDGFMAAFIPIVGCFFGAFTANLLKGTNPFKRAERYWQKTALLIEAAALAIVSFLPASVPNGAVNCVISGIAGFQLSIFRKYEGSPHNTTICTGNLRSLSQYCANVVLSRDAASIREAFRYFLLVFSFPFGAVLGGLASLKVGTLAVWPVCFVLMVLFGMLQIKKNT